MARAAACYALAGSSAPNDGTAALLVSLAWPWDEQWWKPTTVRRDLVKACALALAEIERLDRTAPVQGSTCCKGTRNGQAKVLAKVEKLMALANAKGPRRTRRKPHCARPRS